jgi:hypothetical protein
MRFSLAIFDNNRPLSSYDVDLVNKLTEKASVVLYSCCTNHTINRSYEPELKILSCPNLRASFAISTNQEVYVLSQSKLSDLFGYKNTKELLIKVAFAEDLYTIAMSGQSRLLIFAERPNIVLAKIANRCNLAFEFEGTFKYKCESMMNEWLGKLPDQLKLPM